MLAASARIEPINAPVPGARPGSWLPREIPGRLDAAARMRQPLPSSARHSTAACPHRRCHVAHSTKDPARFHRHRTAPCVMHAAENGDAAQRFRSCRAAGSPLLAIRTGTDGRTGRLGRRGPPRDSPVSGADCRARLRGIGGDADPPSQLRPFCRAAAGSWIARAGRSVGNSSVTPCCSNPTALHSRRHRPHAARALLLWRRAAHACDDTG